MDSSINKLLFKPQQQTTMAGLKLKFVREFVCLRHLYNRLGGWIDGNTKKNQIANKTLKPFMLYSQLWKVKMYSHQTNVNLQKWNMDLSQTAIQWVNSFERKNYGPINDEGHWRIRRNKELRQIYREPEVSDVIRLKWAEHVVRIRTKESFRGWFWRKTSSWKTKRMMGGWSEGRRQHSPRN